MKYIISPFVNVLNINGTASQKEFWIFFVFVLIAVYPILGIFKASLNPDWYVLFILRLVFLIPLVSLGFRRLNDAALVKWLFLIPFVNLILASMPSKTGYES